MTHPLIVHDAKEMAGCFYENDRSAVFRRTWPKDTDYVNAKWHHFVVAVRGVYAELLARPDVSIEDKDRMYEALTDQVEQTFSDGASSPLPILKNSETFQGDKFENRQINRIVERREFSLKEKLRTTTALFSQ
jgi:hypothetical protein